jgi:hypothetical protein
MAKTNRSIALSICFAAGLFSVALGSTAHPSACYPGPDYQTYPGLRWQYREDPATRRGCWYLEEVGAPSRRGKGNVAHNSRSVPALPSESRPTSSSAPGRDDRRDTTTTSTLVPSITHWFSSWFGDQSNSRNSFLATDTAKAETSEPPPTPRPRPDEPTTLRKPQRSKSEQQGKVAQRKSKREQDESASAQRRYSIFAVSVLEAAGDKPVPSLRTLLTRDLQKAIEAVGNKDVVAAPGDLQGDWQRALYEEFLQWRLRQLAPQ